jgi:anti-anti-sigma factor
MFKHSKQGAVDVIGGDVPLNAESRERIFELLDQCLSRGQPCVVLDLRKVPLIDSAGLEALLDVRDRCRGLGGASKLAGPNRLCLDILNATGVGTEFEVFSDVLQAAGSFAL